MAVTIHIPTIQTPNLRGFAVAGVAVLTAAAAVLGVQTLTDTSTTTTATTSSAIEVTTGNFADTSGVAEWAQANGVSGMSPASVGSAAPAAPATPTQSGGFTTTEQFMQANVGSFYAAEAAGIDLSGIQSIVGVPSVDAIARLVDIGVAAPTAAEPATQSGGFTTTEQFMQANVSSFYTPEAAGIDQSQVQSIVSVPSVDAVARAAGVDAAATAPQSTVSVTSVDAAARAVGIGVAAPSASATATQSGGFATTEQFMQANVGSFGAAAEASTASTVTTSPQYDPYPANPSQDGLVSRSNFGSDIDWINGNGMG